MEYTVYILENPYGKLYIGQTSNLQSRLETHNTGNAIYTSRHSGPWKVIYTEIFETRGEAMKRERQLKRQKGGEVLKRIINNKSANSEVAQR